MSFSPKPEHLLIPPVPHGGPDYPGLLARGLAPEDVLDFSASVNPFPPAPEVAAAAGGADVGRYPDSGSLLLRRALARGLGVREEEILVTAGASEALDLIGLAFIRPGSTCLVLGPTYGEYARSAALHGGRPHRLQAREEDLFRWDMDALTREILDLRPDLVYVCSPNNPTGVLLSPKELAVLREAVRDVAGGLVLDQAYLSFREGEEDLAGILPGGDLIVLRSMTKDFGIPGARLGYLAAPVETAAHLERVRTPWSVSCFAQTLGLAALEARDYYRRTWRDLGELTRALREDLRGILRSAGEGEVLPGEANFILAKLRRKRELLAHLARRRILLRDCASFGLSDYVRIGVRTGEENSRLVGAVRDFVEGTGDG